jgi:DNA-binding NtrC family response regulator
LSETVDDRGPDAGLRAARAVPYLVVALECDRPTAGGARYSLEGIDCVTLGRGQERKASRRQERGAGILDLVVPGAAMSTVHARLVRTGAGWFVEDAGSTNGTFVDGARVTRAAVEGRHVITAGRTVLLVAPSRMTPFGALPDVDSRRATEVARHLTLDPELATQLEAMSLLARSAISILVRGETGTGKELLARGVHETSGRAGAFVAVNCGAIPAGLVESHLFGHIKGAFSGAVRDEPGLFRAADGGTLFLDEIGDLPPASQAALLRALQEREVVPVGATRPVPVDLRVVAATHQPLEGMVERGAFRRDLLARLAGFTLELPPLRVRRMDLGVVVASLLRRLAGERAESVRLTPGAAEALLRYDWPLNTRELEQCLGRALVLSGDAPIDRTHLHLRSTLTTPREAASDADASPTAMLTDRDARLRLELLEQLAKHHGNLAAVATAMGKARMQVHRWCKRLAIDPNVYRA